MSTFSKRWTVLVARNKELQAKQEGKPYSEAVLACCEAFLNCFPVLGNAGAFSERSQPSEES